MKCEFEYCVYNKDCSCAIENPEINFLGMCDSCILVSLDKDFLDKEKKRQLLELKSRWLESADDEKKLKGLC